MRVYLLRTIVEYQVAGSHCDRSGVLRAAFHRNCAIWLAISPLDPSNRVHGLSPIENLTTVLKENSAWDGKFLSAGGANLSSLGWT